MKKIMMLFAMTFLSVNGWGNSYKVLKFELLYANAGTQNFKGQIDLANSLGINESIVSQNTSYDYTTAHFQFEWKIPEYRSYLVGFKPGEEVNQENVGAKLLFQYCSSWFDPYEKSNVIDYKVNLLELDLATKTLKYDFDLANNYQCYSIGCKYSPKVFAVVVLNVSYPVPEETVLYSDSLLRGPNTYLFTGDGPESQSNAKVNMHYARGDNTMINVSVPWGPNTTGTHVKLMLFANGNASAYNGMDLTGYSQITFRARSISGAKLHTHIGTAEDSEQKYLGLIPLNMQWKDFAFDISDLKNPSDINSLIWFVLDKNTNPFYSINGPAQEFEIDDIKLIRKQLPIERKWALRDPEVNGAWNWSSTWTTGTTRLNNLNQWGDAEFLTYGTGGEFGWTNHTLAMQWNHSGDGAGGVIVTTSRSNEGINPNSQEDRDAGKDVSNTTELRFNAWRSDPDPNGHNIVQLYIKLHDSHGNESYSTYLNNHTKESTPGFGMHPNRGSFIPVKSNEYAIPLFYFDNGIIDFKNIVSVEFFVDRGIYNMNDLIEVKNLRFHKRN
ncbi:MAG TPA: hypothetical protein VK465_04610 [Fibrobacteria bacterium]|nr:hypothetical protein [Fibrobacteria bacterium]